MSQKPHVKLIYEGEYIAEVEVQLSDDDTPWGPYLSVEEATKLDSVRIALRRGDLRAATGLARVYRLTPVPAA